MVSGTLSEHFHRGTFHTVPYSVEWQTAVVHPIQRSAGKVRDSHSKCTPTSHRESPDSGKALKSGHGLKQACRHNNIALPIPEIGNAPVPGPCAWHKAGRPRDGSPLVLHLTAGHIMPCLSNTYTLTAPTWSLNMSARCRL